MQVSELRIYPLKSARGVAVETAELERRGFWGDRRWMVVDDTGVLVSQREAPSLATVDVRLRADAGLFLSVGASEVIEVSVPAPEAMMTVSLWGESLAARHAEDRANLWLSQVLGRAVRLAYMPEETLRPLDAELASGDSSEQASFADLGPLLLITESSYEDLRRRVEESFGLDRFRANVVVAGAPAYAEDRWRRIRIGSQAFRVAGACSRCTIVTTDQKTGARGVEPLRTLTGYRREGKKVLFGQYLVPEVDAGLAPIRRGDRVEVLAEIEL